MTHTFSMYIAIKHMEKYKVHINITIIIAFTLRNKVNRVFTKKTTNLTLSIALDTF